MGGKDKKSKSDVKARKWNGRTYQKVENIAGSLSKLKKKIKKCQTRQKVLEKLEQDREADTLGLARELRKADRQSAALLAQLQRMGAEHRELERGLVDEQAGLAELRESMDHFQARLEKDAAQALEIGSRTEQVELVSQQVSENTESLAQRVHIVEQALESHAEKLEACIPVPAEALEAAVNDGHLHEKAQSSSGSGSNVVMLKRSTAAENGDSGAPPAMDRELLSRLRDRLDGLERLAVELEARVDGSARLLEGLQADQGRLGQRDDELTHRLEQELGRLSASGEAMRGDLDRQKDQGLQQEALLESVKASAEEALNRARGLAERTDCLETDSRRLDDLSARQGRDLQDLQQQSQVTTEHGRALATTIENLAAAQHGLEETGDSHGAELRQLRAESRRVGDEARAQGARTHQLVQRLDDAGEKREQLEQRLREVESHALRMAEHNQRLQGEQRRLASAQDRLSAGVVVLLLLLCGGALAYWLYGPDRAASGLPKGEIAALRQAVEQQGARLRDQDQGLDGLRARVGELSGSLEAQSSTLSDRQPLLGEYGRRLARTESVVEEAADRVERLALEQESLAADLNELRRSFEELEPATPAMPASPSGSRQDTVGLPGTRWLQQQDPGHYTIQVVAGPYPQGIENVAQGFVQTGPLAHYRRLHDGRDWHVLLYGNFATLGGAREALGALSDEIRSYGPWIRSFRSVQADLQQP